MKIEFDESKPIYLQIADAIKKAIARGDFSMGEKVPSVRELALEIKVNPNTVQHAYQELIREGVLFTKRGQGNFVTEDPKKIRDLKMELVNRIVENFVKEMEELGYRIKKDTLTNLLEEENDRG